MFANFTFRKRYLLAVLLGMELLSLPVAAKAVAEMDFAPTPHVIAKPITTREPGVQAFIVTANAPFNVSASGMVGRINVSVELSGALGSLDYGSAARLPGKASACARLTSPADATVYRATRSTEASDGNAVEQSVVMVFRHNSQTAPTIRFTTDDTPLLATSCG